MIVQGARHVQHAGGAEGINPSPESATGGGLEEVLVIVELKQCDALCSSDEGFEELHSVPPAAIGEQGGNSSRRSLRQLYKYLDHPCEWMEWKTQAWPPLCALSTALHTCACCCA